LDQRALKRKPPLPPRCPASAREVSEQGRGRPCPRISWEAFGVAGTSRPVRV